MQGRGCSLFAGMWLLLREEQREATDKGTATCTLNGVHFNTRTALRRHYRVSGIASRRDMQKLQHAQSQSTASS